jgi:hypothetical protein
MQTFLPYGDPVRTAKVLDNKRLGKQRVETIQIARNLLGITESKKKGWSNHPAVKMWKGHEPYLIKIYLRAILDEWNARGFKNAKCEEHYKELYRHVAARQPVQPRWFCEPVFQSHRSRLIQKNKEFYEPLFPGTPNDLEYVWPVA